MNTSLSGAGLVLITVLALFAIAASEEKTCTVEIPALVVLPDHTLVGQLGPAAFVARNKRHLSPITSVETHRGPRRILFVIETGEYLSDVTRRAETEIISEILAKASGEDSFALLTTRGPTREIGFAATKEDVIATLKTIQGNYDRASKIDGVLDTISEAIGRFQPPREGDSIVVVTRGIESSHRADYQKVRSALTSARVRLFGFQLGKMIDGYYDGGVETTEGLVLVTPTLTFPNRENLFGLALATGGFAVLENTEGNPRQQYSLSKERLLAVKRLSGQLYSGIAEYYVVRLQNPPSDFTLELSGTAQKDLPSARVSYAKDFRDCQTTPSR